MVSPLILSLKRAKKFYNSKIKILSPAKLNLYLNILGKYPGGFHRIESILERISLCDEISIKVTKDSAIRITSNIKDLENGNNLCVRAAKLLVLKYKIPYGFDIFLKKNIPIGSGLGGGSSNAASVFIGLNEILSLKLSKVELYDMGADLGSDVNFFIAQKKFAFIEGRGEKITPLNINSEFKHLVIWPNIFLSTRQVYKKSEVKLTRFFNNVKILQYALKTRDSFLVKKSVFNALEKGAFSICKELEKAKNDLKRHNIFCKLTGSGSALYTMSDDAAIVSLKNILPKDWTVFNCRTF